MTIKRDQTLTTGNRYHLPLPTGPFPNIGFIDIMTGTCIEDGVFVRMMYPAKDQSIDIKTQSNNWPKWLPNERYHDDFIKMSKIKWKPMIKLMKCLSSDVFIPIIENTEPSEDRTFPVIIFSHGVASCRTTYSSICSELASFGFFVFVIEHRDETACTTFFPDKNGTESFKWLPFRHLEDFNDFTVRQKQVNQRVDDIKKVIELINNLNDGNQVNNVLDVQIESQRFAGLFDKDNLIAMGHSFGAATVIKSLLSVDQIKLGVCLDVWMVPVKDVDATQVTKPLLFVNMEVFQYKLNLSKIKPFIGENGTNTDQRKVTTIKKARHTDQSDVPFIMSSFLLWMFKLKSKIDPILVHDLTTALALEFIEDHLQGIPFSAFELKINDLLTVKLNRNKKEFIKENHNHLSEGIDIKELD